MRTPSPEFSEILQVARDPDIEPNTLNDMLKDTNLTKELVAGYASRLFLLQNGNVAQSSISWFSGIVDGFYAYSHCGTRSNILGLRSVDNGPGYAIPVFLDNDIDVFMVLDEIIDEPATEDMVDIVSAEFLDLSKLLAVIRSLRTDTDDIMLYEALLRSLARPSDSLEAVYFHQTHFMDGSFSHASQIRTKVLPADYFAIFTTGYRVGLCIERAHQDGEIQTFPISDEVGFERR